MFGPFLYLNGQAFRLTDFGRTSVTRSTAAGSRRKSTMWVIGTGRVSQSREAEQPMAWQQSVAPGQLCDLGVADVGSGFSRLGLETLLKLA